ncbi:hypothetical protein NL108_004943, partial [Boleophthalmus pectinirostris]
LQYKLIMETPTVSRK